MAFQSGELAVPPSTRSECKGSPAGLEQQSPSGRSTGANMSKSALGHLVHPILVSNVAVVRPERVWATDNAHLPLTCGFVYLASVADCFSRKAMAWELSITLIATLRIEALGEALGRRKSRVMLDTEHDSPITSIDLRKMLRTTAIAVGLVGRGT